MTFAALMILGAAFITVVVLIADRFQAELAYCKFGIAQGLGTPVWCRDDVIARGIRFVETAAFAFGEILASLDRLPL